MRRDQRLQGLTIEHRDVAVGDDHLALDICELLHADGHRTAGAVAHRLLDSERLGAVLGEVRLDLLAEVPDHDDQASRFQGAGGVDCVAEHRTPRHRVQQLGALGLHPSATARRQHDHRRHGSLGWCGVHDVSFNARVSRVPRVADSWPSSRPDGLPAHAAQSLAFRLVR